MVDQGAHSMAQSLEEVGVALAECTKYEYQSHECRVFVKIQMAISRITKTKPMLKQMARCELRWQSVTIEMTVLGL